MISVSIRRKTLVRLGACEDGLALFDAIAAQQPDGRRDRICIARWTPLHGVWAWMTCAGFARWAEQHGIVPSADLRGADLSDAPKIPEIHKAVYDAASKPGALSMSSWHCGTAHCRAGWVITLAGDAGREMETRMGPSAAAALIYIASDPSLERVPDFMATDEKALADMKRLAESTP